MSRRKTHRRSQKKRSKNLINKTVNSSVSMVKSTSRRYMPKVKSGLENVGSKVIKSSKESVPFLQKMTRKFFGSFTKKRR